MIVGQSPEDFRVEEIPLYEASGEGTHTFLWVEKRQRDTEQVARALARHAGVASKEVGYAGRKDRQAITRQWFSVPGLDPEQAGELGEDGWEVLRAVAHGHKLKLGQLRANRFEIRVREVSADERARAELALPRVAKEGFANRFGRQRFGRDGDNAERGRKLLETGKFGRDRRAARFLVSAYQAQLFNQCLDRREAPLDQVELGELAWKHDSGAVFVVEDVIQENERAQAFEISPSGPIIGTKMSRPTGAAGERERAWLDEWGVPDPLRPPRGLRLRGARRPFRVPAQDLEWSWEEDDTLQLGFILGTGSYATVLIDALLA